MQRLWGYVAAAVAAGEYAETGAGGEAGPSAGDGVPPGDGAGLGPEGARRLQEDFRLFDECVAVLRTFAEGGLLAVTRQTRPGADDRWRGGEGRGGAGGVGVSSGCGGADEAGLQGQSAVDEGGPAGGDAGVEGGDADGSREPESEGNATTLVGARSVQRVVVVSTVAEGQEAPASVSNRPGGIENGRGHVADADADVEVTAALENGKQGPDIEGTCLPSESSEEEVSPLAKVRPEEENAVTARSCPGDPNGVDVVALATRRSEDGGTVGDVGAELGDNDIEKPAIAASPTGTIEHVATNGDDGLVSQRSRSNCIPGPVPSASERVVHALSTLAELMVRSDQTNSALWERFLEFSCMKLLVACLRRTRPLADASSDGALANGPTGAGPSTSLSEGTISVAEVSEALVDSKIALRVQSSVLRSISILVHSVRRRESLYCLFVSDHVNNLLSFAFDFTDDEVLLYFMSAVKSIGLSLDQSLVELFFDARAGTFPLYSCTTRFHAHPDGMVRIAVRNLTLTVYGLCSPSVTDYVLSDPAGYLASCVDRLARLCGEIAGAFEFFLDDGREIRRSVSQRVGRYRQKVRMPHLRAELAEVDNVLEYLNDVLDVDDTLLQDHLLRLVTTRFYKPFFRPIASQALPEALSALSRRWSFRKQKDVDGKLSPDALSTFDAASRAIVLAYIINLSGKQPLGVSLCFEILRPIAQFEGRSVLHGIRALASDLTARERTTHIAVCVLESISRWEALSAGRMGSMGLTFDLQDGDAEQTAEPFARLGSNGSEAQSPGSLSSAEPGLVMSLVDFRAPLTPTGSLNKAESMSSDGPSAPPSPKSPTSPYLKEEPDDEGILSTFRRGEASLREIVSAILLVVRTREVRSVRVAHAVVRLISAVGLRTGDWRLSLDIAKISLDEMASTMTEFLANSATTIVAIEAAFDNFTTVCSAEGQACSTPTELWALLHIDSIHKLAADLPDGAGLRRRSAALGNAAVPPVEMADATSFFVLLKAYERLLNEVLLAKGEQVLGPASPKSRSLSAGIAAILLHEDAASTYLDKKEALARVAHLTLKYNMFSRSL